MGETVTHLSITITTLLKNSSIKHYLSEAVWSIQESGLLNQNPQVTPNASTTSTQF